MRNRTRVTLLGCVGALALAAAGQAFAAYSPKLVVQMGNAGTTIKLAIPATDDPTAKLRFFAPAGTGANLSATPGSTIGTLDAKATAAALGGATLPLTGSVQVRAASGTYLSSGQQVPLARAAMGCTGTATHAAYWVLVLTAAGQTLEVPLFVDPVSTAPLSAAVAYALDVCLPPSDIPESLGGAAFGAKVFEANFTVKGVFSPTTSGDNVWRLLATPYNLGKGTPNAAATVEAQSFVEDGTVALGIPARTLTRLAATFQVSGTVKTSGLSDTSPSVSLARGTTATKLSVFAHPRLKPDGTFTARFAVRRVLRRVQAFFVQAVATAPQRDLATTDCKATFGVPCIGATASGFADTSTVRKIVVPPLPPKRR
jgi:hypothetical protein